LRENQPDLAKDITDTKSEIIHENNWLFRGNGG
jgi:hypothetical protein